MVLRTGDRPFDMDQLEREIGQGVNGSQRTTYVAAATPAPALDDRPPFNALQTIAYEITQLTWREAEQMGAAIQNKIKDNSEPITAAIQSWAAEWETFKPS